jgi:hypothetical protein
MEPADADRRMAAQGPDLAHRLAPFATRRIVTDGTFADTEQRVTAALAEALERRDSR